MKNFIIVLTALLHSACALSYPHYAEPTQQSHGDWAHRSVIYFAPTNDQFVKQFVKETLINDCELDDRDVVTLVVTADGYTMPSWVKHEFNLAELFSVYGIEPQDHTAVLIGKDGDEKLRWGRDTDWDKVKNTIDLMPMRQVEMASRVSPCSA